MIDLLAQAKLIGEKERLTILAERSRGRRRAEPSDGAELALAGELLLNGEQFAHDRVVLLFRPRADRLFAIVAENGVEHRVCTS